MSRLEIKIARFLLIFTLILSWVFSGWPNIWNNPPFPPKVQQAQAVSTVIFLTTASSSPWTLPSNWNDSSNTIEVVGGGGGADDDSGGSGGGGAYGKSVNVNLPEGGSVSFTVGAGGAANVNGGNTWICNATTNCGSYTASAVVASAKGGAASNGSPGAGGDTSGIVSGVGSVEYAGGNGERGSCSPECTISGSGGGGAAGPNGPGGNGGLGDTNSGGDDGGAGGGGNGGGSAGSNGGVNGGAGGNNFGGTGGGLGGAGGAGGAGSNGGGGGGGDENFAGGAGGNGTEWDATHGSGGGGGGRGGQSGAVNGGNGGLYGGGGGGKENLASGGGNGAAGLIVITYTPLPNVFQDHYRWRNDNGPQGDTSQTLYFNPTGNGFGAVAFSIVAGCSAGSEWDCVDDGTADTQSTAPSSDLETSELTLASAKDYYTLADNALQASSTVTQLDITIQGADDIGNPNTSVTLGYCIICDGANDVMGSAQAISGADQTKTQQFTGLSLSTTDLNNMQLVVQGDGNNATISTLYVLVTYSVPEATWAQSEDIAHTNLSKNTNIRLRFQVDNTGGVATSYNYRLEWAAQSGTCDTAYSGESYAAVPDVPTTQHFDMTTSTSTLFVDGDPTTAKLSNAESFTFVAGDQVESTSTQSGAITLDINQYTEVEYVFQANTNATDGGVYCFRVTNAGTALNSADVVAQVTLDAGNSAPTLSGVTLKKGDNSTPIVLVENTTTSVVVVGTGTDTDGGADMTNATATIYLTGVSGNEACSASDINCYPIISGNCTLGTVSGNDRAVTCTTALWFLAERTDDDTATWTGFLSIKDAAGSTGTGTDTEEVNTLQALDITATVSYGTMGQSATTATTSAVTMQVTTTGNEAIDVTVQATNDMCEGAACPATNEIRACQQQYTTNTNVLYEDTGDAYAEEIEFSSTTARNLSLESVTPTTHAGNTSDEADNVYWKIGIPAGQVFATYNGTTTITSKANTNTTDDVNEALCN